MITIFQHIVQDSWTITSVLTYFGNFITGKEGDLPVGKPDRYNSSCTFFLWQSYDFCFVPPIHVPGNCEKRGI